jgi:membrane-associated phospholipid phosphatase
MPNYSWLKAKITILIIYIILSIIFEQFYRKPLFTKSIELETKLYSSTSINQIKIFKLLSKFGTQTGLIPLLITILILFPINISYTFASVIVLSSYYDNILKLSYGSPRPFWINPSIKRSCDGGFGNPSGHSFSSFAIYLSLWDIITNLNYFNRKKYLKIALLIFFILFSLSIAFSRIFLSVHSINQIIYGSILGIGMYFYFFHIIELHKFSGKKFNKYIIGSFENKIHTIKFCIYFIILFALYLLRKNNWEEFDEIIKKECPHLPLYRKFNNDGFFIGLVIFLLIGAHYGLYYLFIQSQIHRPFKEEQINKWSMYQNLKNLILKILIFIPHSTPMIIYLLIPKNAPLYIIFPFKVILPYILSGFCFFGVYINMCIQLKLAYQNIYINYRIGSEADNQHSANDITVEVKIEDSSITKNPKT